VLQACDAFVFAAVDSTQDLCTGDVSLVEHVRPLPPDGATTYDAAATTCMRFVHWDSLGTSTVGRWLRLDNADRLVYAPPTAKVDLAEEIQNETIKIILKSTSVHMVRATGPRLPAMPSSVLWLRDLHEFAADPEPCCICTQFVAGGSDRASSSGQSCTELPVHCSICRLHTHVSCAAQLTAANLHAILLAMLESAPPLPPMPISLANTCGHNDSHQGLRTVLASLHFFIQDRLPDVPVCAWCLALAGSALSKAADRMGQHP